MALDDPVDLLLLGGYELQDHDLQQLGGAKNTLTDLVVATEDTAEDPTADWFKNLEDFLKTHKPIGIKASVLIYESESESDSESDSESEPKLKSKVKLGGGRRPKTDNTNTISSNIVLHSWHGMSKKQPQIMDYQSDVVKDMDMPNVFSLFSNLRDDMNIFGGNDSLILDEDEEDVAKKEALAAKEDDESDSESDSEADCGCDK